MYIFDASFWHCFFYSLDFYQKMEIISGNALLSLIFAVLTGAPLYAIVLLKTKFDKKTIN